MLTRPQVDESSVASFDMAEYTNKKSRNTDYDKSGQSAITDNAQAKDDSVLNTKSSNDLSFMNNKEPEPNNIKPPKRGRMESITLSNALKSQYTIMSGNVGVEGDKEGNVVIEVENPYFIKSKGQKNDDQDNFRSIKTGTTGEYFLNEGDTSLELNISAEIISHASEKFKKIMEID